MIFKSNIFAKTGGSFLDDPIYFTDIDHQPLKVPVYRHGPDQWDVNDNRLGEVRFVHVFTDDVPLVGRRWMCSSINNINVACKDGIVNVEDAVARTLVERGKNKFDSSDAVLPDEAIRAFQEAVFLIKESPGISSGDFVRAKNAVGLASWALEEECLLRARRTIQITSGKKLRFGSFAFMSHLEESESYKELYSRLFNAGTAPFYRSVIESERGKCDWDLTDRIVDWLKSEGKHVKGHPLLWFLKDALPDWMRKMDYANILQDIREHVPRTIKRFKDRIGMWDVINEAHGWANHPQFDDDQLIEIIRLACDLARDADSDAKLVVNCCLPFAEYAVKQKSENRLNTPYRYLKALQEAGVDYDIIGLQFYCNQIDWSFADVEELLNRFSIFNKPIAITETGCPSRSSVSQDNSQIYLYGAALNYAHNAETEGITKSWEEWYKRNGYWRKPWNENVQADWLESLFLLAKAHPRINELTCLDLSDRFLCGIVPYGGLVDSGMNPKLSYERLLLKSSSQRILAKTSLGRRQEGD